MPTEGPLLRAIEDARDRARQLLTGQRITQVADQIVRMALDHNHSYLYGSSSIGHMLVGAALARSQLGAWQPGMRADVLLVEGPVASTAELAYRARTAVSAGAESVDATVVASGVDLALPDGTPIRYLWVLNGLAQSGPTIRRANRSSDSDGPLPCGDPINQQIGHHGEETLAQR